MFHAFTGCNTISAFAGRGKKSSWEAWKAFEEVTPAFMDLSAASHSVNDRTMSFVGVFFVVLLYGRTNGTNSTDEAYKHLFTQKVRAM